MKLIGKHESDDLYLRAWQELARAQVTLRERDSRLSDDKSAAEVG